MHEIKAITFDLDGVYFPIGKKEFLNSIIQMGVPESEVDRVFAHSEKMSNYKKGRISDDDFWSWVITEWKLQVKPHELIDKMISFYEPDQNVKQVISRLRNNGYKILACSNNFPARIKGLNKRFSFLDDFDVVVLSYKVGETKPAAEIFEELISKTAVSPSSIVMADDKNDNVLAARTAGITAFLYEDFDKFMNQLRDLGVKA